MTKRSVRGKIIRYGLSIAVIALIVVFARTVNWHATWESVRHVSIPWLVLAIVVNLVSLLVRGVRWWMLLRTAGAPSLSVALRATLAGAGLNNVLIANGGDAARVVFITRATGLPTSRVLATVALDRLLDPIGFVVLLLIELITPNLSPDLAALRVVAIVAAVALLGILWWLARRPAVDFERLAPRVVSVIEPMAWWARAWGWIAEFGRSMRDLASGKQVIWLVLLTLLAWAGQAATFGFVATSAHAHFPVGGTVAALLAVNLTFIIRATPGNVGFFQFAYALIATQYGMSEETAVAIALLIQTIQVIPVTLIGIALAPEFLLRRRVHAMPR